MRKSLVPIGETEMEILRHVWAMGKASVTDVHERILQYRKVAYTTIMTVMRNLARKGYLTYDVRGRSYIYRPAVEPEEVKGQILQRLIDKVFNGSPIELVKTLINTGKLTSSEKEELKKTLEAEEANA